MEFMELIFQPKINMRKLSCDNKNAVLSFYVCFSVVYVVDIEHALWRINQRIFTETKFRNDLH